MTQYITVAADDRVEARNGVIKLHGPEGFEGMRRAVTRGTALTHHLLSFSRRRPINPEPIHLAAHLRGMREMLDRSLGGHIHIEMKFAAELWPVELDAGELELAMSARQAQGHVPAPIPAFVCKVFPRFALELLDGSDDPRPVWTAGQLSECGLFALVS